MALLCHCEIAHLSDNPALQFQLFNPFINTNQGSWISDIKFIIIAWLLVQQGVWIVMRLVGLLGFILIILLPFFIVVTVWYDLVLVLAIAVLLPDLSCIYLNSIF